MDIKYLIGEVAARHNMRVEADDPVFALVTVNQLVLREVADRSEAQLRTALAEFIDAAAKLQNGAGQTLAQHVKHAAAQARQGFQQDVTSASAQLRETLHRTHVAQTRAFVIRWTAVGILGGLLLFICGVIVGKTGLIP
jgi:hypothetical protein